MAEMCCKYCCNDWDVVVARSPEDIEAIRPVWEQMQDREPYPVINADIDRFLSVIESSDDSVQPYVILAKQNDQPRAMVVGRLEMHAIPLRVGYKTILKPKLRCMTVVHGGILGQPDGDVSVLLIQELMKVLRQRQVDVIFFNHIRTDSCIFHISRKLPGVLIRGYFPKVENHWSMSVPENLEGFYQARSKKHRGNLKRYISKLDKEYRNQVRIITYTEEDDLDEAIKAASQISCLTYQHGLDSGFTDNPRTRVLLTTAARQGWLRMSVLYINGEPGAFQVGQQYGKQYMLEQIGFDPEWSSLELGTVLFIRVLEDICADLDTEFVDFGFGDADYKRSYGNKQWQEASVHIFAPRPYPIFINMVRTFMMSIDASMKYLLSKTGLAGWVKRRWRDLLQVKSVDRKR
jgi:hypothetical protein